MQEDCRGVFFKGYIITMKVDPRDVLGDGPTRSGQFEFVAQITGDNQVTITAPLLDYNEKGKDDELIRQLLRVGDEEENTFIEALENHHVKFENLKLDNEMKYVLDFGPGVKLSSDVLEVHRGKTNGYLTEEAMPTRVRVEALGPCNETAEVLDANGNVYVDQTGGTFRIPMVYAYFCGVLYWRVADLKLDSRKQRVAAPNAGTSAAEAMMGRMNLNGR